MRKVAYLTFFLLLIPISCSVWADWIKISENDKASFYIDADTVRKDGYVRKFWIMHDLKAKEKGVFTRRARMEIDCNKERSRYLSFTSHSGSMNTGEILFSSSEATEWLDVPPRTADSMFLVFACKQ